MRKVYDVQYCGMPEEVRNVVKSVHEVMCNGCYFQHEVMPKSYLDEYEDGSESIEICEEHTLLDDWLVENGAVVGESVLILYWW